ncbi:NUDIX hydrolase [Halomicrococcus gelatinilyticus]|uniref:NUDIX hydrolase n=1 Tax=Halomicrococcus gelatinilyticus TaxID=1702103 RepID=UPI002E0E26B0
MDPQEVRSTLVDRADAVRADLVDRWGEVRHRRRDPLVVTDHEFPDGPDGIFPWVAVAFVVEDDDVLLVRDAGHDHEWEPPGGKGEAGESPAETAEREAREEAGVDATVTDLLFTETLPFDYGASVTAPVLQAGFVARRTGGRARGNEDRIEAADWFPLDDLPDSAQFRGDLADLRHRAEPDGDGSPEARR